jgi:hypothetical protein
MTPLFAKLNLATANSIHILNAPESFEPELEALAGVKVARQVLGKVSFALAFVKTKSDVDIASVTLTTAAEGDAVLWLAYPKASSKNYKCEFNRDSGWDAMGKAGYEPVRQVAVDADWSALRFRKAEFIKTMKRNPEGAISEVGRHKARKSREA